MVARLSKALMCLCLALFAGLVAADNIVDYGANYAFVRHVLSMDTVFPGNTLRWRAITSPALWSAAYAAIIAAEALTALCFGIAAARMFAARRAPAPVFRRAKDWAIAGASLGFLTWFLGFMVIGGEWFAMWQSAEWNGQQPAFRFYATMLLVLLWVMQPDPDHGAM